MSSPFISVVIATRNRASVLRQTLSAIHGLRWPADRLEVLVVDNGSADDTWAVVSEEQTLAPAPVRYIYIRQPGKSLAVNTALTAIRGEFVAFTDDDVQPEADWLAGLAEGFEQTGADFLAGRILPIWAAPPPPWMSPALYGVLAVPDNGDARLPLSATGGVMPIGANMAVRRSALERVGGLCETLGKLEGSLRTGEDHEFFLRLLAAGCRGMYEPRAVVRHLVPAERLHAGYFRRWLYQNGRDVARLQRRFPVEARTWAGVPRYLWREAACDAWSTVTALLAGDARTRVASSGRLAWFGGYVREVTCGAEIP